MLVQDHSEVFERLLTGEFESVQAAARAGGILREKRRVTTSKNVKAWAGKLAEVLTDDELEAAAKELTEHHKARWAAALVERNQQEIHARMRREASIRGKVRRHILRQR